MRAILPATLVPKGPSCLYTCGWMSKQEPGRSNPPQNVERGNRDEEREARVDEMVRRLRKNDGAPNTDGTAATPPKPPAPPAK
jgi:hypothetical protein